MQLDRVEYNLGRNRESNFKVRLARSAEDFGQA